MGTGMMRMTLLAISLGLVRALLWSLALQLLLFTGTEDSATLAGALAGAILGGVAGVLAESQGIKRWYYRTGLSIAGFAVLGGVGIWHEWSAVFGPKVAHIVALCLGTGGLVFGMEVVRPLTAPVRAIQSLLFVCACIQAARPHRHGHLERPYWLVERLAEFGTGPETFWKLAAMLLILGALLILGELPERKGRVSVKKFAVGGFSTLLLFLGLWVVLPQPSSRPAADPVPPHAPDAPPPPPRLKNLPWFVFLIFANPPSTPTMPICSTGSLRVILPRRRGLPRQSPLRRL